nr:acyltransferase [uncultured Pedobacter sp.]
MKYIKSLDTIRAVAVFLVVISHWYGTNNLISKLPLGLIGVNIFFIISGFLITNILLGYKSKIESHKEPFSFYLKKFYYRRTLRIFPIYYLLLFGILIFNLHDFEGNAWWHFAYLSNFYFVFVKNGWEGVISPLWSLSVEEQFYLFWPFLILFSSKKIINIFPIGLILFAIVYRYFKPEEFTLWNYSLMGALDALGAGALIAIYKIENMNKKLNAILIFIFIILGVLNFYYDINQLPLVVNIVGFYIIVWCIGISNKSVSFTFEIPFILYLGRISYGIYLYHNFIPRWYFVEIPKILNILLPWFFLIVLSSISYYFIELPLLKLKDKKFNENERKID